MTAPGPLPLLSVAARKRIRRLHKKKFRLEDQSMLLEGARLVADALDSGVELKEAVILGGMEEKHRELMARLTKAGVQVMTADEREFSRLSNTVHSQGILATTAELPDPEIEDTGNLLLGLDAVSDPGNLGTLLRTAEWFGVRRVFLGRGCVDPFNPKVVRASMGSILRLQLRDLDDDTLVPGDFVVVGAVASGGASVYDPLPERMLLLMGSEAAGFSGRFDAKIELKVTIPAYGAAESLNVAAAAAIILAEHRRQHGLRTHTEMHA